MSSNFFSQEDEGEFQDIPEEVNGGQAEIPNVRVNRPVAPPVQQQVQVQPEPEYNEGPVDNELEEEEDFSAVLNDARFRLEQGRLYEMIMNNNLFEGTEGDGKAAKYVMKQIRNFAKEQMEIMLGMRQEKQETKALSAADFPFNDLEVQTLKALASAATKGATASPAAQSFSGAQAAPKQTAFKPISAQTKPASTKTVVQAKPAPMSAPLPKKAAPIQRSARTEAQIEQILREEGISREEYERQYNPQYKPLEKPLSQMTENEIIERNKLAKTRRATNPQALPMPTPEQEEFLHSQRAAAAAQNPQMQSIMSLLTAAQNIKK